MGPFWGHLGSILGLSHLWDRITPHTAPNTLTPVHLFDPSPFTAYPTPLTLQTSPRIPLLIPHPTPVNPHTPHDPIPNPPRPIPSGHQSPPLLPDPHPPTPHPPTPHCPATFVMIGKHLYASRHALWGYTLWAYTLWGCTLGAYTLSAHTFSRHGFRL